MHILTNDYLVFSHIFVYTGEIMSKHRKTSENDENPGEKQMTPTTEIVKVHFNLEQTGGRLNIFLSASFTHI